MGQRANGRAAAPAAHALVVDEVVVRGGAHALAEWGLQWRVKDSVALGNSRQLSFTAGQRLLGFGNAESGSHCAAQHC